LVGHVACAENEFVQNFRLKNLSWRDLGIGGRILKCVLER
jgi:hypothetical protein